MGSSSEQCRHEPGHHGHDPEQQERRQQAHPERHGGSDADPAGEVLGVGSREGGELGAEAVQGIGHRLPGPR